MPKGIKTDPLNKASGSYGIFQSRGTSAGDDMLFENDSGTDLFRMEFDNMAVIAVLDGTAASDFSVRSSATDILRVESDTSEFSWIGTTNANAEFSIDIQTSAGNDFRVTDGTNDLIHIQGDLGSINFNLATSAGNDFVVNDGSLNRILIQGDAGGDLGGNWTHTDGSFDFDIATHDGTNGLKLGGTIVRAGAAEIDAVADVSTRLVTITGTGSITVAANEGKTNLLGEVGGNALVTLTLPAATGTGATYKFIVSVLNTSSYVIQVANATDVMTGSVKTHDDDSTPAVAYAAAGSDDTIELNGGTKGGAQGDTLTLVDILSNKWAIDGNLVVPQGSNIADPFSAGVS